jgi:hypothetical protein
MVSLIGSTNVELCNLFIHFRNTDLDYVKFADYDLTVSLHHHVCDC